MEHSPRKLPFRRAQDARRTLERKELMDNLSATRVLIQQAYTGFNTASDRDLIDSYVFEITALQSRYAYLLRRVKELEGSA